MSEHPRDDEELQSFLEGNSALSRRYKDASDEQPPAKVDAAILAASEWAVGAEPDRGQQRSTPERPGGAAHVGSRWWDKLFSRWSVPLATAAVVVIAATLTLMIERDPELERIENGPDSVALNAPGMRADDAEQTIAEQNNVADADQSRPAAPSREPAPAMAKPKREESERVEPAPERLAFRPVQQEPVAAKDSAARQQEAVSKEASSATGRAAMPAGPVLGEVAENVAQPAMPPAAGLVPSTEEKSMVADVAAPVERRRDNDVVRTEDVAAAGVASEQTAAPATAETGAFSPEQTLVEETEPADGSGATLQTAAAEQDGASAPLDMSSSPTQTPASSDSRSSVRDPEQWIADIEEQLALGNRELARAAVRNFRERYPDYKLPDALAELLPANEPESAAPDMENQ